MSRSQKLAERTSEHDASHKDHEEEVAAIDALSKQVSALSRAFDEHQAFQQRAFAEQFVVTIRTLTMVCGL